MWPSEMPIQLESVLNYQRGSLVSEGTKTQPKWYLPLADTQSITLSLNKVTLPGISTVTAGKQC